MRRAALAAVLLASSAAACTALFGLPDVPPLPAGAEGGSPESGPDGPLQDSAGDTVSTGDASGGGDTAGDTSVGNDGGDASDAATTGDGDGDAAGMTTVSVPVFNPPSKTANNDFPVALSSDPGATLCFTLDGTTPTCGPTGSCTSPSLTYSAATRVSINGTVTDVSTGQVTLTAIACAAGETASQSTSQVYVLQVAAPTMVNPSPGTNLPYQVYTPMIQSATVSSTSPSDAVSIWVTVNGSPPPSCTTGTQVANPTTFGVGGSPIGPLEVNTNYYAIGCKAGYAPSTVYGVSYTLQLNAPALPPSSTALPITLTQSADDTKNAGSGDWICGTTDGTVAECSGTSGQCTHGAVWPTTVSAGPVTVSAIACGPAGLGDSAVSTVTYN